MTNTRKITIRQEKTDGTIILRRAIQFLKKDGTPTKRAPLQMAAHIVIFPNGDYRYYDRNGTLARSRISATRAKAEMARDMNWVKNASLAQLAR